MKLKELPAEIAQLTNLTTFIFRLIINWKELPARNKSIN